MKTASSLIKWLAVIGLLAFSTQFSTVLATVTFTSTPAVVSNTYPGTITLQIGGLTNTETVVVRKYLDLNHNNVVDAGEPLVQQFSLMDGQGGMVIGGVTNVNVPGDLNSTTGAITATLNFQNGDFMQNIAANYLYVLLSPGGHFTPITNSFTVTNFPFAQQFTGNVVSNGTSATVPNAVVMLFPAPSGGGSGPGGYPLAAGVANSAGRYAIPVPPGTYVPLAFGSNYIGNYSASPVLTLASGQTLTTNLTLTNATSSLAGNVVDANNPSKSLPGVWLHAMSSQGLIAIGFTDTNGNFILPATSGSWKLGVDQTGLIVRGYVGWQNETNVTAGTAGITLACPKATALFYGKVTDGQGNPLSRLDISASDNVFYQTDGYTDTNGNYVAGVVGGLGGSDPWQIYLSSSSMLANYIVSQPAFDSNNGTNVSNGTAVSANFTVLLATNQISGTLKDSNGNPLAGVGVGASATLNGISYQAYVDTSSNGSYTLNVANGTWSLWVSTGGGSDSLSSSYLAPSGQVVTINNSNATLNFTALLANNQISGTLKDSNGNPLAGVGIWTSAMINGVNYNPGAVTDAGGNYSFNVINGTWTVNVSSVGDSNPLPVNELCPPSQTVALTNSNATLNFTALLANNQISGTVKDGNGNPIAGVGVGANATLNGTYYQAYVDTGTNGAYTLNVANGIWSVWVSSSGGSDSLDSLLGSGQYQYPGNQDVTIANNNDAANFTVVLCGGVQILTTNLPSGLINSRYDQFLQAASCSSTFTWSVVSGSLPPGLGINSSNGEISGNPSGFGTFSFTVRATDGIGLTTNQPLAIYIAPAATPLQITSASLTNAIQNAAYSAKLTATGGQPPYTWSLAPGSASLPSGLFLTTNGVISGKPIGSGTSQFIVTVADATAAWTYQILSLTVNSSSLPQAITLAVGGQSGNGTFAFSFEIASGVTYTVQSSTDLKNWVPYETFNFNNNVPASGGSWIVTVPATASRCFYRVKVGP